MKKVLQMTYQSSLTDLCSINSSFDKGVLRVAYHGENRNHSEISKEAFMKCIQTMFNCPIVCNYDRETDTLGGHDIEIVRDKDGDLQIVNSTTPVGCIPESARYWWDEVEEDDGTVHEYLFVDALLWKRQEAYQKIKRDGVTAHSMEITVKDGELIDGIYHIYDFEFTAFALIGVTPCFESAALEVFSKQDFKKQMSEMMDDLRASYQQIISSNSEADDITKYNLMKGGETTLQDKNILIEKYEIDVDSLDFSIEDYSYEELEAKFAEMKAAAEEHDEQPDDAQGAFALTGNMVEELMRTIEMETVEREWGECTRYWYADCDFEAGKVYCWDTTDWLLYGFSYTTNGDSVVVDFDSKKRMKYVIAEFDEGDQASPFAQVFAQMEQRIADHAQLESKFQEAESTISAMNEELGVLRQYKSDNEAAEIKAAKDAVFKQFADLAEIEAFKELRENCSDLDVAAIEEKCYAIRGRNGIVANFSHEEKTPKLKVTKTPVEEEPYGGIFTEYGIEADAG